MTRSNTARWTTILMLGLAPLLSLQCASTSSKDDGVEEKIAHGIAEGWTQHLVAEDMTTTMTLVDQLFSSPAFPTRYDLQAYLTTADERNYFKGAHADFSDSETRIKNKKATIAPIKIHTQAGTFLIGIHLSRNGQGWMVSNLDWEMY